MLDINFGMLFLIALILTMQTVVLYQWTNYSTLLWSVITVLLLHHRLVTVYTVNTDNPITLKSFLKQSKMFFVLSLTVPFIMFHSAYLILNTPNYVIHNDWVFYAVCAYYSGLVSYVVIRTIVLFRKNYGEMSNLGP